MLCNEDAVDLPKASVDVALCATLTTTSSSRSERSPASRAIKPGGKLVIVDFKRIEGVSSAWTLSHVGPARGRRKGDHGRGVEKSEEVKDLLKDNYMVIFTRTKDEPKKDAPPGDRRRRRSRWRYRRPCRGMEWWSRSRRCGVASEREQGGVRRHRHEGSGEATRGLERAATLLNLTAAFTPSVNAKVAVVLHGDATATALDDAAYKAATGQPHPASDLLAKLAKAGVEVQVCGQSLARKGFVGSRGA